ncbi:hypothetical protein I302_108160 [Kwoniella bestiolae CBS 10118]|uniref:DUF1308 domain-containing protein n=1 Tax=Kwoniella bestiolae CBS 10118 TaxID=1296100 RepID=A0A1B9FWG3_9TREE|nr:hypothetical protein I302_07474 [Kwoniella bestiolae CBS 10118]OCF23122.1 hypothetical protein I302_07474 [Kwoniella bestiolae CBS 10118]
MSQSQDFTPNLHHARLLLTELISHIQRFDLNKLMYRAPILDRIRFEHWSQDEIMGFKKWLDGVENHGRLLDAMIDSRIPPKDDPIPTVLNLITYWKIIITSQSPMVGVKMSMGGEKRQAWPLSKTSTVPTANVNGKGKEKEKEVWVDVIAQGGREWIRIYSKKISHLLAEFREADSYVNSDFDSDSESDSSAGPKTSSSKQTTKTKPGMDNSLVTTAQDLLRAANSVESIPGAPVPSITIHLTRIPATPRDLYRKTPRSDDNDREEEEEADWPDNRIPLTFQHLQSQGINLIFGDLSDKPLSSLSGPPLPSEPIPNLMFNLDITTLLGLCSDVLHHPLPISKAEAARRSLRPTGHLLQDANGEIKLVSRGRDGTGKSKNKVKRQPLDSEEEEELKGQSQNSIELYKCILEEMERPFVQEFNEVIEGAWKEQLIRKKKKDGRSDQSESLVNTVKNLGAKIQEKLDFNEKAQPTVEFYTTLQAAQYTYEALSSGPAHGHGMEQRRMRRMLGLEEGDFFEGSRYEGKEGFLRGLKVRIFDLEGQEGFRARSVGEVLEEGRKRGEDLRNVPLNCHGHDVDDDTTDGVEKTGFHQTLYSITSHFLDQYYLSLIADSTTSNPSQKNHKIISQTTGNLPNFLQPRKLPTPPIAKISLPFPVVSLHSLQRGAKEGMTTIMMGTATLKEVWGQVCWRVRGWERGWYDWEEGSSIRNDEEEKEEGNDDGTGELHGRREKGHAAIMIFPYRVFGEGKRVRFEKGDYSYPTKDWWDEESGVGGPQEDG